MNRRKIDRIYEAVQKINQVYDIWAASHGLTLYEMQMYYEILRSNKQVMTQKNLSQKLDAPKTSINSIIKRQLQTGYIELHINPQNKREKVISLTPEGRKFAEKLIKPLLKYENEAAAMLDDEELEIAITVQNEFADILLEKVGGTL